MKKNLIFILVLFTFAMNVFGQGNALKMVSIPGKNIKMLETEVSENLYRRVMGELPTFMSEATMIGEDKDSRPVCAVGFYEAIVFCNKLSELSGLKPVYSFNGSTRVEDWNFPIHKAKYLEGMIAVKKNASGYRLPTVEEWQYAANAGETHLYSGSNNIDDVAWYSGNSENKVHQVALKKPNEYGLYDMTGNVSEWCWDWPINREVFTEDMSEFVPTLGGSFKSKETACMTKKVKKSLINFTSNQIGFRVVCLDK